VNTSEIATLLPAVGWFALCDHRRDGGGIEMEPVVGWAVIENSNRVRLRGVVLDQTCGEVELVTPCELIRYEYRGTGYV